MKIWPALLAISLSCFAQDARIFGRVRDAQTHEPVRRAIVKIYDSKQQWDEFTDGEGRFKFPPLARAIYTLIGHRDGYSDRAYTVELSDFDDPKELPIELYAQGVVTGTVTNRQSEPLERAQIEAVNVRSAGPAAHAISCETNDLGEFRLSGLDPGIYRIRATYREGGPDLVKSTPMLLASAYFGGVEKPAEIAVKAGALIPNVNFVLNPVHPAAIRGTLQTASGPMNGHVSLWIQGQAGEGGHNGFGQDGRFQIADVAPGVYIISAETGYNSEGLFGSTTVTVRDIDVDGVNIQLHLKPKLDGQILVKGAALADLNLKYFFISAVPRNMAMGTYGPTPDHDGKFSLGLIPGTYTISVDSTTTITAATLNGRPITDLKFQVDEGSEPKKLVIELTPKAKP